MRVSFSTNLNKLEIRSLPFVKFWISVLKILLSRILNYICFSLFGPFESLVPVSLMFVWSFCFDASGFVFCSVLNISVNPYRVLPIISYHLRLMICSPYKMIDLPKICTSIVYSRTCQCIFLVNLSFLMVDISSPII